MGYIIHGVKFLFVTLRTCKKKSIYDVNRRIITIFTKTHHWTSTTPAGSSVNAL